MSHNAYSYRFGKKYLCSYLPTVHLLSSELENEQHQNEYYANGMSPRPNRVSHFHNLEPENRKNRAMEDNIPLEALGSL